MKTQPKNDQYLIAYGNLYDGFTFVGPFDSYDAAIRYAEHDANIDWVVCTLYSPDFSAQDE